ncbi:MAG: prepilin-type N-terminal cleavage/methylation domain-containing protein [Candidatus Gracilibacteria bacterium]|nr:prepilin-type N-terminal cleavage/methylation domain-containing protein [Candidatus Gracilibacteria bacterium]
MKKSIIHKFNQLSNSKTKAFTLVELIVTITILAILGTIAFISFQGYSKNSRDSVRISDTKNAEKGLEIFSLKSGRYPEPDTSIILVGGTEEIKQGIIGENVVRSIDLNTIPLDPKTGTNYIYSVFGDGQYYQIAYERENLTTGVIKKANAEETEVIVLGNYSFDPSLPSLITVKDSVGSGGIYDPSVCFIVNGGENKLDSKSGSCLKKEDMILKNYDDRLVGYWDMETLSGTTLLDLSGNGHNATFSGTYTEATGGILGGALQFQTGGYIVENSAGFNNYKDLTIKVNFFTLYDEYDTWSQYNTGTTSYITYHSIINRRDCSITCTQSGAFRIGLSDKEIQNYGIGIQGYDILKTPYIYKNITNSEIMGTKKWYELVLVKENYKKLKIYLNQKLIFEKIYNNEIFNSEVPFYIGTSGHALAKKQNPGVIDDVKIYNSVLSEKEILQQAKIAGF